MGWTRRMLAAAMVAAGMTGVLAVTPGDAQAGKPGGGGGTTGPAGRIVFAEGTNVLWVSDLAGNGTKVAAAGLDYLAGVTQARHGGGQLWFFQWRDVAEPVVIGNMRRDLFAIREDGQRVLRLTNDPNLVSGRSARPEVLPGDAGLSLTACRWEVVAGVPTVSESGHFTAQLVWDLNDEPQLLPATLRIPSSYSVDAAGNYSVPAWCAQYTADGRTAVFSTWSGPTIYRADFGSELKLTSIGLGDFPRLAPDGTRVAYQAVTPGVTGSAGLSVCNLDGSGVVSVTQSADHAHPVWSPDSQNLAYANRRYGKSQSRADYSLCWIPAKAGAQPKTIGSYSAVSVVLRWIP